MQAISQIGNQDISISIYKKRWIKFKTLKRGYYSFITLIILYGISFFLPLLINSRAIIVHYNDEYYFPAVLDLLPGVSPYYSGEKFNLEVPGEADYRKLKRICDEEDSDNWIIMPFYKSNPFEDIDDLTSKNSSNSILLYLGNRISLENGNVYILMKKGILFILIKNGKTSKIHSTRRLFLLRIQIKLQVIFF